MSRGWSLGKLFGFPLHVDPSALLVLALILFMGGWGNLVVSGVFVLAIAVSVVIHELGHAVVIKAMGWDAEIVIHGFGGVTLSQSQPRPWQQVGISLAGPVMNGLQMGVAFALIMLFGGSLRLSIGATGTSLPILFLDQFFMVNLLLGVFNILPIYPLDGGQAFQFVLRVFVPARAERVTAYVGLGLSVLVCAYGAANRWWFLLFIALFLLAQNWQMLRARTA